MKFTLHLVPLDRGPFNNMPARDIELEDTDILCNNIILPEEFNPHNVRLYVIGNEFGDLVAFWGPEHEILDNAVDLNRMDSFMHALHALLGSALEPFDLTYWWIQQVKFDPAIDWKLLCRFAEARGNDLYTLYF